MIGISGIYDLRAEAVSQAAVAREFLGCDPSACPGTYEAASPAVHASEDDPATVLRHDDADEVVPARQSTGFRAVLAANGVSVDLLTPGEAGHVEELDDRRREPFHRRERRFPADTVGLPE